MKKSGSVSRTTRLDKLTPLYYNSHTMERFLAAYISLSGKHFLDDTHSGCLFQAAAAGEPECVGFPFNDDLDIDDLESRMGFSTGNVFYSREETLARYGFELAEQQDEVQ